MRTLDFIFFFLYCFLRVAVNRKHPEEAAAFWMGVIVLSFTVGFLVGLGLSFGFDNDYWSRVMFIVGIPLAVLMPLLFSVIYVWKGRWLRVIEGRKHKLEDRMYVLFGFLWFVLPVSWPLLLLPFPKLVL